MRRRLRLEAQCSLRRLAVTQLFFFQEADQLEHGWQTAKTDMRMHIRRIPGLPFPRLAAAAAADECRQGSAAILRRAPDSLAVVQ